MTITTIELEKGSNKNYILNSIMGKPVTITLNAGDGTLENNTKVINTNGTYGELPEPTYTGHQFIGWYTNTTYETEVTSGTMYKGTNATILYAKYIVNKYNVTLSNNNKVTLNTNNVEIEYGKNGKVTAIPLEGYYLSKVECTNGYTTNANVGTTSTNEQEVTISNNNKDTNATCTFEATVIEYDVEINIMDGVLKTSVIKVPYNGTNTVTITPTTGFYFESVSCTNGYTTNAQVGENTTDSQIITIFNNEKLAKSVCTILISNNDTSIAFLGDSWSTIIRNIKVGNSSKYTVGLTTTVDMGDFGIHTLRIANNSNYNCTLESKTACGFVIEFADVIVKRVMNSGTKGNNVGGWPASGISSFVNNDIFSALPEELKKVIINTTVISGHGTTSGESNFTSIDKIYLLSTAEVWQGGNSSYDSAIDSTITRQLDYYYDVGIKTSGSSYLIKKYNGNASVWWLRSAISNNAGNFNSVNSNGNLGNYSSYDAHGVSPAFRIG